MKCNSDNSAQTGLSLSSRKIISAALPRQNSSRPGRLRVLPQCPCHALQLCQLLVSLPLLGSSAMKQAWDVPREHSSGGKCQPGTEQCPWAGLREVLTEQWPGTEQSMPVLQPGLAAPGLPGSKVSQQEDSSRPGFVSTRSPPGPHFQPLCSLESFRVFLKGQKEISLLLFPKSDFEAFNSPASPKCCYFFLLIHRVPCYLHMPMTFLSCV